MIHPRSLVEACTGHLRQTRQWQSVSKAEKYELERESATSAQQDLLGSFESIDLDSRPYVPPLLYLGTASA